MRAGGVGLAIACILPPNDAAAVLLQSRRDWRVQHWLHLRDLVANSRANTPPTVAVVDVGATRGEPTAELLQALDSTLGLAFHVELDAYAARILTTVARSRHGAIRVLLRSHSDTQRILEYVVGAEGPSAEGVILAAMPPALPDGIAQVLVGAAVAGTRRSRVADLAALCRMPLRTLEYRLRTTNLMPARQLLAWAVALHTTWRLEVNTWSLKQAADAAGYSSASQLSTYIARHTGMRPRALEAAGFYCSLNRFVSGLNQV